MSRRLELFLVTALLLLAVVLRMADLTRLPPGFNNDELATIRMAETVRRGQMAVYYEVGDGQGRAGAYAIGTALVSDLVGGGLLAYRVLPFWTGLLTLAMLYRLARRLFSPEVALVALGVMTVNLRAILLARSVTAESFVPLYLLIALLAIAHAFHLHREVRYRTPDTMAFASLAALFGLSGYLHYALLPLGLIGALFFVHLVITRQPLSRRTWNATMFLLVLATVVALPFLISTLRDFDLSEPYVFSAERPHNATDVVDGLLSAVGGIVWRGDLDPTRNLPESAVLGPALTVLFLLGLFTAIRRWRQPRYVLVLLPLVFGLLTDAWVTPHANFSANLIVLPSIYMLVGVGSVALWVWLRARPFSAAWQPVATLLAIILVVNLVTLNDRLFHDWRHDAGVEVAYHASIGKLAAYLDRTPDDLPVSICSVPLRGENEVGVSERQMLGLMMHRSQSEIRFSDCRGGLVFINGGEPFRFAFTDIARRDEMPPSLQNWLADAQPVHVDGLPEGSVLRVDVAQRLRDAGGQWSLYAPTEFDPETNSGPPQAELPVALEKNLTFAGYDSDVFAETYVPGGDRPVVLVTYWRVDGPLPNRLGIFAHVVGLPEDSENGRFVPLREPWAEANSLDVVASRMQNRDVFVQVLYIWLGESLRDDRYALMIGSFDENVFNHLRVLDRESGALRGDRLLLGLLDMAVPADDGGAPPPPPPPPASE